MYDILCLPKLPSGNKIQEKSEWGDYGRLCVTKKEGCRKIFFCSSLCPDNAFPEWTDGVSDNRCQPFLKRQKFVGGIIPEIFFEVRTERRQMRGEDYVVEGEER